MVNYACASFIQSESGKYFEWIIIDFKCQAMGVPICREHLFEGETLV